MGSWFSNLHIRKNGALTKVAVAEYICKTMTERKYLQAASREEADGAFVILSDDRSDWYSVYSDLFSFDDTRQFPDFAVPMSGELKTDVLGLSCFDSDYLYLNLIDSVNQVDAWVGVGSAAGLGIRKRTNLSAWKSKVRDFSSFKENVRKKYIFAEEVLAGIENCIQLPRELAGASYEYLDDPEQKGQSTCLYFKLPESEKTTELPSLVPYTSSLTPCCPGKYSTVNGINRGGASRGLSVHFIGPYVEKEEITFSDVCLLRWKNEQLESTPIELSKAQLPDGQWAYSYHDPGFRIPPKVDDRLPRTKWMRVEREREIIVRFMPHGDPRKMLDITVVLVPDKNPEGQTWWNVWKHFGSKEAYIKFNNMSWKKHPDCEDMILNREDYE